MKARDAEVVNKSSRIIENGTKSVKQKKITVRHVESPGGTTILLSSIFIDTISIPEVDYIITMRLPLTSHKNI